MLGTVKRVAAAAVAWILLLSLGGTTVLPAQVDLSPASWPSGELELYTERNADGPSNKPQAEGAGGLVVGTTGALAVRAGLEALRHGGSAADAALVTALAEVTLAAGSWVSYAGIMSMVHYSADNRKVRFVNGEYTTVLGEIDPLSIPSSEPSGRTALVPGFMRAVEKAHDNFGKLPWALLFEPAIYFAEEGFPIDADLAGSMAFREDVLSRLPATREIFFKDDGSLYKKGQIFRQPQLARTLRRVAEDGADYMYTGAWAENFVAALQAEGGEMALEDLRRYEALVKKAKKVKYAGYDFWGSSRPAAGGNLLAKTLKMLKPHDLPALGHYTESADTLYEMMKATRAAYTLVPPLEHSDAVVAVDAEGNVAAILHSINTLAWGETGIFVDGVSIPDSAARQRQRVKNAGPGKRIWTATFPLIVTKNRKPLLASSAIGSGLFEATIQSAFNVLLWEMEPKDAVRARIYRGPVRLAEGEIGAQLVNRGDFRSDVLDGVRARGIPVQERNIFDFEALGYWVGVSIDPESGVALGATHNAFNGWALAD
jgi:gamma-glutamyltranspeptidase/glutathione hydrolase